MIATLVFIALLILDVVLIIVAFTATDNRLFADILASVGATILSWYLAMTALAGNVGDTITVPLTSAENITHITENVTNATTTIGYTSLTTATVDPALGLLLSGVAAVMTVVSLALVLSFGLEISKEI